MNRPSDPLQQAGFVTLFAVSFRHDYYNLYGGRCPDLAVRPTPASVKLMASLGMIFQDQGAGFCVLVRQSTVPALISYLAGQQRTQPNGQGCWSWLSFLLVPCTNQFVGLTDLPITTNPMLLNLHGSNLHVGKSGADLLLGGRTGLGEKSLYPVTGSSLTIPLPAGAGAVLTDLSGATVATATADGAFRLSALKYGFYSIGLTGAGTGYAGPLNVVYVPLPSTGICLLDLVLARPTSGTGNPAAFPVVLATGTVQPVSLVLAFKARRTIWSYYIVSQGDKPPSVRISGRAAGFTQGSARLPNGDDAVVFTAKTALPLRQRSPYHFSLTGSRNGSAGGRDDLSVADLPAAPASPVWPNATDGSSEIYVYL